MSRTILVKVTQEHIARGRARNCMLCPVALAVAQTLDGFDVDVYGTDVRFSSPSYTGGPRPSSRLTRSAQRFISRFDGDRPVKPFNFKLVLPDGVKLKGESEATL